MLIRRKDFKGSNVNAIEMKLSGLTYREIGLNLGVSRQRAQQLCCPPYAVVVLVRKRAKSRCQDCGFELGRGHIHHTLTDGNSENWNDIDNLVYLCLPCHRVRHGKYWKPAQNVPR